MPGRRNIGRRTGLALAVAAFGASRADAQAAHVDKVNVVEAPADFPARMGSEFTLLIHVTGRPAGASVVLREVWRPPLPGVRDPAANAAQLEISKDFLVRLGDTVRRNYAFDRPWKLVPGKWLVEYWDGVRKMQSRGFTIYSA